MKRRPTTERPQDKQHKNDSMKAGTQPKLNAEWHKKHPMPKNPSLQQRIEWHLEHNKNCSCRVDIPVKLM